MEYYQVQTAFFPNIGKINFEGKDSKNPMAFHYYDENCVVMGKTMKDWLRFAMAWWHTLCADGVDQFGGPTKTFPWNNAADPISRAKYKMDAAFEFMTKCSIPYYCFHDVDVVEPGDTLAEFEKRLATMVEHAKGLQQTTGQKLLWSTANVFGHKRYMNGAATNPDFHVTTFAATQIKNAINDALHPLGVAVVIEARHLCMSMRGVQKQSAVTTTSDFIGAFERESTREEFFQLIGSNLH